MTIRRKYGLDRDGANLRKNYPIPPHILNEVGLPLPPIFGLEIEGFIS